VLFKSFINSIFLTLACSNVFSSQLIDIEETSFFKTNILEQARAFDQTMGVVSSNRKLFKSLISSNYDSTFKDLVQKYPSMTVYKIKGEDESFISPEMDNNCSMPGNFPSVIEGIDISSSCRGHDYCFTRTSKLKDSIDKSYQDCNLEFYRSISDKCYSSYPITENFWIVGT
jgi:hypothetical protein